MLRNFSISQKFTSVAVIAYLIAAGGLLGFIYYDVSRTNTEQAIFQLESFEELASGQFELLEERYTSEIQSLATNRVIVEAVESFSAAWDQMPSEVGDPTKYLRDVYITNNPHPAHSRDQLLVPLDSEKSAYDLVHAKEHRWFSEYVNERSTYLDLLLVATDGTVMYSAKKTDVFASNLNVASVVNELVPAAFAIAERNGPEDGPINSGYTFSAHRSGEMSSFLLMPIWDDWDEIVGYLAFELSQQPLIEIFDQRGAFGENFNAFAINQHMDQVFQISLGSEFSQGDEDYAVMGNHDDSFDIENAKTIIQSEQRLEDYKYIKTYVAGQSVVEIQGPINLFGHRYVSVWQVPLNEVMAPTYALLKRFGILMAVSTLVFGMVIWRMSELVTLRLRKLQEVLNSISSKRDVTERITIKSTDEVGQSAKAINQLLDVVEEFVRSVKNGSTTLGSVSSNMREASAKMKNQAENQAAAVEELSASLEETESQASMALESTKSATEDFNKVTVTAKEGQQIISKMVTATAEISKSSSDIAQIIKVIDGIAFQTNILALNAAVEAARAGVHGRGFATVAEEVGNLAKRSAEAASQTTALVEQTLEKIRNGTGASDDARHAFQQIVRDVEKSSSAVQDIAQNSREQVESIRSASKSAFDLSMRSYETTERGEEAHEAASQLKKHTAEISRMVATFTIPDNSSASASVKKSTKRDDSIAAFTHRTPKAAAE